MANQASTNGERVLVVGTGGIGGVVSGHVLEHTHGLLDELICLTTNARIADSINERGLTLLAPEGKRVVKGRAHTQLSPQTKPFDWVLLATQPPQVEAAAKSALPWLKPDGHMVCFQNGLCEQRIASIAGKDRVVGAVVAWGAAMREPGVYERTSSGGFTLGSLEPNKQAALGRLSLLLEAIGPVTLSDNLAGARWSKLAINCAISTLGTLGRNRLGALMIHRVVRRLALEIMTEVVQVAHAEAVRLEKVSGTIDLDWISLNEAELAAPAGSASLVAKHSLLLAVGARYRRMRSSMLSAIERGRPPAVDFLNGEVVDYGARHGIATPYNKHAQRMIHELASNQRPGGMDCIRELAQVAKGER